MAGHAILPTTRDYPYRADLIRNYVSIIIHEALRIQPPRNTAPVKNGATRISHLFLDLLERQFPIENSQEPLRLRTAQDYAKELSVHVNYLNRSLKEVTGKPTSAHISGRIAAGDCERSAENKDMPWVPG